MKINHKQEQLIEEFREDLEKHFPDVRFVEVTESWENPNDLWIHVISPEDEDREIELVEFFCEKATDIFMNYRNLTPPPDRRGAGERSKRLPAVQVNVGGFVLADFQAVFRNIITIIIIRFHSLTNISAIAKIVNMISMFR